MASSSSGQKGCWIGQFAAVSAMMALLLRTYG
jgi:hypothetical protein